MDIRHFLFLLLLFWTGVLHSQGAPQLLPARDNRHNLSSVRIIDTILTSNGPLIIDTTIHLGNSVESLPPNFLGKSMMTPTAWGSEGGGLTFVGLGATFPQIYTTKPDMIGVVGLAAGDPRNAVGVMATLNVNDVSRFRTFSANLVLHRRLSNADAVAVGGIHLLASRRSDAGPSYFVVYSHAVQAFLVDNNTGTARLQSSIGAGTGRFYDKSPADDIFRKRGAHGTLVFANLSFQATPWLNTNLEWSGLNLHTSVSVRPLPALPFINLGLADLTRNAGDRKRFIVSLHYALPLWD